MEDVMSSATRPESSVTVRRAKPEDAAAAGPICYRAFHGISTAHNFPPDLPNEEFGTWLLNMLIGSPGHYTVVAEINGEVVGSNALDERNSIAGIGPITVRADVQERDIGRRLMTAVMDRAKERGFAGIRLVQAAFNTRSLSLYTKLGFEVREPLACIKGAPLKRQMAGYPVRAAKASDLDACNTLCRKVHGHDRAGEIADALQQGSLRVCERAGSITAYATSIGFIGHAVAESNRDLIALISAAEEIALAGMLLPMRNTEVFQWCLANSLRVTQPLTLMSVGLYNEPKGAFIPSILY
jgi:ribosomal protein S18 acetylase RimI-like enzyme